LKVRATSNQIISKNMKKSSNINAYILGFRSVSRLFSKKNLFPDYPQNYQSILSY
ncbi:39135_t:CDS:1, partial [Gigaspora margarita]